MSISVAKAIEENKNAIKAMEKSIERLMQLRKGQSRDDRKRIANRISSARAEIIEISIINANLEASVTVIAPMSQEVEQRLQVLADRLDRAIRADALLNARLETVLDVIAAAEEVSAIIDDHS
jgi:chromosome segregation ATPase